MRARAPHGLQQCCTAVRAAQRTMQLQERQSHTIKAWEDTPANCTPPAPWPAGQRHRVQLLLLCWHLLLLALLLCSWPAWIWRICRHALQQLLLQQQLALSCLQGVRLCWLLLLLVVPRLLLAMRQVLQPGMLLLLLCAWRALLPVSVAAGPTARQLCWLAPRLGNRGLLVARLQGLWLLSVLMPRCRQRRQLWAVLVGPVTKRGCRVMCWHHWLLLTLVTGL